MGERSIILDVKENIKFHTIYEAINYCAGTNYTGWMKACWPIVYPKDGFRMWFPKLSPRRNGKYISEAFDCINVLSDEGNYLIFDDLKQRNPSIEPEDHYWGEDLIFAKEVDGDYLFRGVFVRDGERSSPNHMVSKRIATRVKLIGQPARRIELLDSSDNTQRNDDINTPMKLKRKYVVGNGIVRYVCGRCEATFNKAPRCPECGQLVEI